MIENKQDLKVGATQLHDDAVVTELKQRNACTAFFDAMDQIKLSLRIQPRHMGELSRHHRALVMAFYQAGLSHPITDYFNDNEQADLALIELYRHIEKAQHFPFFELAPIAKHLATVFRHQQATLTETVLFESDPTEKITVYLDVRRAVDRAYRETLTALEQTASLSDALKAKRSSTLLGFLANLLHGLRDLLFSSHDKRTPKTALANDQQAIQALATKNQAMLGDGLFDQGVMQSSIRLFSTPREVTAIGAGNQ